MRLLRRLLNERLRREQLAAPNRTAEAQQAVQPMDGPARRLACHMLGEFFAFPIGRRSSWWSIIPAGEDRDPLQR
jgi:hypothetical protein